MSVLMVPMIDAPQPAPIQRCQACREASAPINSLCPVCRNTIVHGLPLGLLGQSVAVLEAWGYRSGPTAAVSPAGRSMHARLAAAGADVPPLDDPESHGIGGMLGRE